MRRKRRAILPVLAAILFIAFGTLPASAQLVGTDTAPGSSCAGYPAGATRFTADADQDGAKVTLICDGSIWNAVKRALTDLSDVNVASPADGLPLVFDSASSKWVQAACDSVPDGLNFPDKTDMAQSVLATSNIALISGVTCATATVTITGDGTPEYQICANSNCSTVVQSWTVANGVISSGQYIQLRLTTSGSLDTTNTATLNLGGTNYTWNVKTIGPKRVFVTSTTYNGNLGGLVGADSKCQARAVAAGLPGTFKAWLSDGTTSASSRLDHSTVNYVRTDGVVVANGWSDLTDATLDAVICKDENSNIVGTCTASRDVWTNTQTNGSARTSHCLVWTSNQGAESGYTGGSSWSDLSWTAATTDTCNTLKRLYCFEQETGTPPGGGSGPGQGGGSAAGNQGEIQFNSGNYLATDPNFVFTSAGNLGVGTAAPDSLLHIKSGIDDTPLLKIEHNVKGTLLTAKNDSGPGETYLDFPAHHSSFGPFVASDHPDIQVAIESENADHASLVIQQATGQTADLLQIRTGLTTTGDLLTFTSAGRLGLGTAAPQYLLDAGADGTMRMLFNVATPNTDAYSVGVSGGVSERFEIRSLEGTRRQALVMSDAGSDTDAAFAVVVSNNSGASWSDSLVIEQSGEIGIGTDDPQATLDVDGGVRVANDATACASAKNGTIRYISGGNPPWEFCNGSAWSPFKQPRCINDATGECYLATPRSGDDADFVAANIKSGINILGVTGTLPGGLSGPAGCANIGDLCADGTVFAGYHPITQAHLFIPTTDQEKPGSPGTYTMNWKNATGTNDITPKSDNDGEANHGNRGGAIADFEACKACEDLTAGGQTDWYLPSRVELYYLWSARGTIEAGGNITNFQSTNYWSSTEQNNNLAWSEQFSGGDQSVNTKTNLYRVRCLRR